MAEDQPKPPEELKCGEEKDSSNKSEKDVEIGELEAKSKKGFIDAHEEEKAFKAKKPSAEEAEGSGLRVAETPITEKNEANPYTTTETSIVKKNEATPYTDHQQDEEQADQQDNLARGATNAEVTELKEPVPDLSENERARRRGERDETRGKLPNGASSSVQPPGPDPPRSAAFLAEQMENIQSNVGDLRREVQNTNASVQELREQVTQNNVELVRTIQDMFTTLLQQNRVVGQQATGDITAGSAVRLQPEHGNVIRREASNDNDGDSRPANETGSEETGSHRY